MRLESPWWLLLLILFPLIGWVRRRWFGGRPSLMFSSVQLVRGITGLAKPRSGLLLGLLRWTALLLFVIGMARPQWGCLLYTSPSPRDRTRSRMPSSA